MAGSLSLTVVVGTLRQHDLHFILTRTPRRRRGCHGHIGTGHHEAVARHLYEFTAMCEGFGTAVGEHRVAQHGFADGHAAAKGAEVHVVKHLRNGVHPRGGDVEAQLYHGDALLGVAETADGVPISLLLRAVLFLLRTGNPVALQVGQVGVVGTEHEAIEHEVELAVAEHVVEACRVDVTHHVQHLAPLTEGAEGDAVEIHVLRVERPIGGGAGIEIGLTEHRLQTVDKEAFLATHLLPFAFLLGAYFDEFDDFVGHHIDHGGQAACQHRLP